MNIFDMEITEESLYTLDTMLESVDAQRDVVMAIHKYEMMEIHMESVSDEVLMEAANNIFDRIIVAIKKVFKVIKDFVDTVIKAMKDKFRKVKSMFVRATKIDSNGEYKPDYTIYDYAGLADTTASLSWVTYPLSIYSAVTSQHNIGFYTIQSKADRFTPSFDGYKAYLGAKRSNGHMALGSTEDARKLATAQLITSLGFDNKLNINMDSGEFIRVLPSILRGDEIPSVKPKDVSNMIDVKYKLGVKWLSEYNDEMNAKHHEIVDNMQRLKNIANDVGFKEYDEDSKISYDFAIQLANTVTNNINATLKICSAVISVYSQAFDGLLKQSVQILTDVGQTDRSIILRDLK